jgi:hypothetical protein
VSNEAVKQVAARAITDEDFRAQLRSNPQQALSGYDLTDQERQALATAEINDPEDLDELERLSKWCFINFHTASN